MKRRIIFTVLALLLFPILSFATYTNVAQSAYTFLNIDSSVKAGGMGGAYSTVCGDVEGLNYNLATVATLDGSTISFTYMNWALDTTSLNNVQLAIPLSEKYVLSLQWKTMNYAAIHKYDEYGFDLRQQFVPNDVAGIVGLSTQLNENLMLGVGFGVVRESIDHHFSSAYYTNLGLIYKMDKLSAGIAANYLPIVENDMVNEAMPLPMTFRIGVSYIPMDNLLVALDVEKPNDNTMKFHIGFQYTVMEMIDIRLGYKTGSFEGLTLGLGYHKALTETFNVGIDYAFGLVSDDFNSLHRIGVTFGF